jgi:hypothetical protein
VYSADIHTNHVFSSTSIFTVVVGYSTVTFTITVTVTIASALFQIFFVIAVFRLSLVSGLCAHVLLDDGITVVYKWKAMSYCSVAQIEAVVEHLQRFRNLSTFLVETYMSY